MLGPGPGRVRTVRYGAGSDRVQITGSTRAVRGYGPGMGRVRVRVRGWTGKLVNPRRPWKVWNGEQSVGVAGVYPGVMIQQSRKGIDMTWRPISEAPKEGG